MTLKSSRPALGLILALALLATACADSAGVEDNVSSGTVSADGDTDDAAAQGNDDPPESADAPAADPADEASSDAGTETDTATGADTDTDIASTGGAAAAAVDVGLFFNGALAGEPTTEPCTLSGGVETTCLSITVAGDPVSYNPGPFCPATIEDSAEAGGIWFDGNGVYDLDGAFFTGLAELYEDDNWLMYDENGNIFVTETAEEFDLAARPNVDPSLQNHCVEGRAEWLDNGGAISSTVVIPTQPVLADAVNNTRGNLGVTLDGVVIAQSAPVDAILGAYTIAAFDDCGGHYNPVDGYHLHGATGCSELETTADGETPMFAYAMDGIPVHSPLDDPASAGLDECNGHDTGDGYHYHANSAERNLVITCLVGQTVSTGDDGGDRRGPPPGRDE